MTETAILECLICGDSRLKILAGYEGSHLVRCVHCGFVFSNRIPSSRDLDVIYDAYTRGHTQTVYSMQKMSACVGELLEVTQASRILDIACGDGVFASMFIGESREVFGTEFDERAMCVASENGLTMLSGGLTPAPAPGLSGTLDLVVLTEVIEHTNNPNGIADNISHLLSDGGYLYITTPNFSSIERRIMGPQWGMICYPEHVTYWTPRTIDYFLRRCGYRKIFLRTENISVFRLVQFMKNKGVKSRGGSSLDPQKISDEAQAYVNRNAVLSSVKNIANVLLQFTGMGSSMKLLYKKI